MGASARFLVTAGSTREPIDQVRVWGNIFTGNTGFAIARELAYHGHVDLLTSNEGHAQLVAHEAEIVFAMSSPPAAPAARGAALSMTVSLFQTHAELRALLAECMARQRYQAVFMTAAVADYTPAGVFEVTSRQPLPEGGEQWTVRNVQAKKVKSSHREIAVLGARSEKLVDLFRGEWGYRGLLVKFKLEVGIDNEKLLEIGRASRKASGADYLVANTLEMVEGPEAGAFLIGPDDEAEFVGRAALARRLARLAMESGGAVPAR